MKKILVIFGTRPEAIKLAPLILQLQKLENIELMVCATGQHRDLIQDVLETFNIELDVDLDLMQGNQQPISFLNECLTTLDLLLEEFHPNITIVQGDTTSTLAGALASFHWKIPIAHVESGLRTHDRYSPFPEEMNRVMVDHLSTVRFAPTQNAVKNLKAESLASVLTGNTIVDAIDMIRDKIFEHEVIQTKYQILITVHRRENFGLPLGRIIQAVEELVYIYPGLQFIWPVHPNPNVKQDVQSAFKDIPSVHLIEPAGYLDMVRIMMQSRIIMTDSGGLQEEAPSLRKPLLILREKTERPEIIGLNARLTGTYRKEIIKDVQLLLNHPEICHKMASHLNPFGDGWASKRIVNALIRFLHPVGLHSV